MGRKIWAVVCGCLLLGTASARAAPNCASDGTIEVCVVSAAISPSPVRYMNGNVGVDVFLTLRITNVTPDPVNIAFVGDAMSFNPENAPAITPQDNLRVSGMNRCLNACGDPGSQDFTTFSPGRPLVVQVSFNGGESGGAIDMLRGAASAMFTATLSVGEQGRQRFAPLPTPEFSFGNGLAKH
ncbi:MAG: hypothetical protein KGJ78_18270 [Alphaproteobacteria bacterium]|nr:hypothetical protein [Alphaproteobacteria bacterium]